MNVNINRAWSMPRFDNPLHVGNPSRKLRSMRSYLRETVANRPTCADLDCTGCDDGIRNEWVRDNVNITWTVSFIKYSGTLRVGSHILQRKGTSAEVEAWAAAKAKDAEAPSQDRITWTKEQA